MKTLKALKALFVLPLVFLLLLVINYMTSPGTWWVQWPALGLGIAWVVSLFQVLRAIVIAGGLAAFVAYLSQRS